MKGKEWAGLMEFLAKKKALTEHEMQEEMTVQELYNAYIRVKY